MYGFALLGILTASIIGFFKCNDPIILVWSLFFTLLFVVIAVFLQTTVKFKIVEILNKQNFIKLFFRKTMTEKLLYVLWILAGLSAITIISHLFIPGAFDSINKGNL